jgi:Tfp pilus assembly protein PilF
MFEQLSRLYFNTGLDLLHSGKINDALIVLKNAVSLDDTNVSAWNLLGLCYYKLCRFKMAEYCWMESLKVNTHGNKANEYIEMLNPINTEAEKVTATVNELVSKKRFKEADQVFEKSMIFQNFYECSAVKNYAGILKKLAGDDKKALALWKGTLEHETNNSKAVRYIIGGTEQKNFFTKLINKILKGR